VITWVTSDHHFFHENIIKYENRPFSSIDEMHKVLIERWNCVVGPDDTVYHLGDVGLARFDRLKPVLNQLNGHKILIAGNHDERSKGWWSRAGFITVKKSHEFQPGVLLTHWPTQVPDGQINIHGHIHSKSLRTFDTGINVNVSVEVTDYYPVNLLDLIHNVRTIPESVPGLSRMRR
jgi:calcineurin-like phosphoesterase family protein